MSRWHRWAVLAVTAAMVAALAAFTAPASAHSENGASEGSGTYLVTVQNLTENQLLTPAVVAVHDKSFRLFKKGHEASNGIQQLAENGGVPVLVAELNADDDVESVSVAGSAPVAPGASVSTYVTLTGDNLRISVAAMLICTNDGFAAAGGIKVGNNGMTTKYGRSYDAGTEINTQIFNDLVPPCSGISGVGTGTSNPALAENGVIRRHAGITEIGDLSPAADGWSDPVIKVTIEKVATYEITITNLTSGQLITPAVFAAHSGKHELFKKGEVASNGIQQLAENGGVPVLVAEVAANPDIAASAVVGSAPLAPGTSASVTVMVVGAVKRFSIASMLICTNDGFGGIDSKKLPKDIGDSKAYYAKAYDAGTELNTELFNDLVPPCDGDPATGTGMSNPALAEDGKIRGHEGITGVGDLTDAHDWDGAVIMVTVERIG